LQPTIAGTWVSPDIEKAKGRYLRRGEPIGVVASLDRVQIRATAGQDLAGLMEQAYEQLDIRVKGRPEAMLRGKIEKILPAGQEVLPSQALGYAVGGSMPTLLQDPNGVRTAEKFFEILITPSPDSPVRLLCGQRIIARIQMPAKPLALRWWQSSRRLFQRRFHI
jgi:putative peptide zinc metalloprotease protein